MATKYTKLTKIPASKLLKVSKRRNFHRNEGSYAKYNGKWYKIEEDDVLGNFYNLYPVTKTTKVGDWVVTNTGDSWKLTKKDKNWYAKQIEKNNGTAQFTLKPGQYVETPDGKIYEPGDTYYAKTGNITAMNGNRNITTQSSPETMLKRTLGWFGAYNGNSNTNLATTTTNSRVNTTNTNKIRTGNKKIRSNNINTNISSSNKNLNNTPQSATLSNLYIIKSGDTLSKIAANNNMTIDLILALNSDIKDPNKIYAGRSLNLSNGPISLDLYNSLAYTPTQLGLGSQAIEDTQDLNSNNFLDNITLNYLNNNFLTSVSPNTVLNNKVDIGSSISNYLLPYANLDMNKLLSGINYSALSAGLKTPDLVASEKVIPSIEVNPRDYYKNKFDYVDSVPTYDFENTGYKFDINKLLEATKKYF